MYVFAFIIIIFIGSSTTGNSTSNDNATTATTKQQIKKQTILSGKGKSFHRGASSSSSLARPPTEPSESSPSRATWREQKTNTKTKKQQAMNSDEAGMDPFGSERLLAWITSMGQSSTQQQIHF